MNDLAPSRLAAMIALIVTAIAVAYTAVAAVTGAEMSLGWLIQAIIHVGELAAVVALALSGVAGPSRAARLGLGAAMLGQAVLAVAELVWPRNPDLGNSLFGVGPVLTGLGLVVAGTALVRAGRGTGLPRLLPVIIGTYTLVALIPIMVGSGGPPAPAALWTICGWDLLWCLLAVSVLTAARWNAAGEQGAEQLAGFR